MASCEWKALQEDSGATLLHFVAKRMPHLSSKKIKRAIDEGKCCLNGRIERFSSVPVGKGDCISFLEDEKVSEVPLSKKEILYADEVLVAYNKPPGIISEDPKFLIFLKDIIEAPTLLHRLDKNTSGILLFATEGTPSKSIEMQFRQRHIEKTYLAIIDGIPKPSSGIIEMYMGKIAQFEGQTMWGKVEKSKGLLSQTHWQLLQKGKDASLVQCEPKTGRTHQLRVHLASIGHPILGDGQYGHHFQCKIKPPRMMLHASQVKLTHPLTHEVLVVKANIPHDFKNFMEKIIDEKNSNY